MTSRRRRRTPKTDTVRGRAALRLVSSDRREMSNANRDSVCGKCAAYTQDVWVTGRWITVDDVPIGGAVFDVGSLLGTVAIAWENGQRHGQASRVVSQHDLIGDMTGFGFFRIHNCKGR